MTEWLPGFMDRSQTDKKKKKRKKSLLKNSLREDGKRRKSRTSEDIMQIHIISVEPA